MAFQKGHNGKMNGKPLRSGESYKEQGRHFSSLYKGNDKYKDIFSENLGNGMLGREHSKETKERMSQSAHKRTTLEYRKKLSQSARRGKNNPLYINGNGYKNDTERTRIMKTPEYKHWRKSVFERDDWTCQHCGGRGGTLRADHIKPFALYPELRLDLNNGQTLCDDCHKKTPTYGGRVQRLKVELVVNNLWTKKTKKKLPRKPLMKKKATRNKHQRKKARRAKKGTSHQPKKATSKVMH